jgi:hypothetical protein
MLSGASFAESFFLPSRFFAEPKELGEPRFASRAFG